MTPEHILAHPARAHDSAAVLSATRLELARLPGVLDALVVGLDERAWRTRPAAAEWAPVEIICHLRDEEVEDFGARLRVIVDGQPRFEPIDPERWARDRRYREADPRAALQALHERRGASLAFLASVAPEQLRRAIERPRVGALSGLDLLVAWAAHDRLHLAQLAGTLARLWAQRWAPLRAEYAGPIPYPPADASES